MKHIKVTRVEDRFVVSQGGTWLPGSYATEESARLACTLAPSDLERIWDLHKPNVLTVEHLSAGS